MYLRKFSLEFVACKLSLTRNWQGYATSFSTSLVRCNSTKQNCRLFRGLCEEFIEEVVCKEEELPENELKLYNLGSDELKVLVVKQKGRIYATGTKCTHYGAPLVKGYLGNGRLRCQWHGACFNLESGDIEDFPGFDSLPCYEVKVSEGKVIVRASKELVISNKRVLPFIRTVDPQSGTFLVVGGGPAGTTCAETLRTQGFDGRIYFITGQNYLPYDRVKLSKNIAVAANDLILRPKDFYLERNIELIQGTKLVNLNISKKEAILDNGQTLKYDKIFLATGSSPRRLDVEGADLQNVFVLRTVEDAENIKAAVNETTQLVILGTSFIGMEIASYYIGKVQSIVIAGKHVPFKSVFGPEIGNRILKVFQEKGVQFQLNRTIESFVGEEGKLKAVILSDNMYVQADVCILGIGSTANTSYLDSSTVQRRPDGTIEVNDYLQTSSHDVFAGGDIAAAPVLGEKDSIGHWGLACYHGNVAAYNMLSWEKPLKSVPFFWTMLFGKAIRHTGYAKNIDETVISGDLNDLTFIAFHCCSDIVVAVTTLNKDPLASKFAEMLYEGKILKKSQINEWLS